MPAEPRGLAAHNVGFNKGGRGEMTKAPISLQDLRRRIYRKAKAEAAWRFWGLYVHVCKLETLREAYRLAQQNDGAPGVDGVTFEAIEAEGLEAWLQRLREELRMARPRRGCRCWNCCASISASRTRTLRPRAARSQRGAGGARSGVARRP